MLEYPGSRKLVITSEKYVSFSGFIQLINFSSLFCCTNRAYFQSSTQFQILRLVGCTESIGVVTFVFDLKIIVTHLHILSLINHT